MQKEGKTNSNSNPNSNSNFNSNSLSSPFGNNQMINGFKLEFSSFCKILRRLFAGPNLGALNFDGI